VIRQVFARNAKKQYTCVINQPYYMTSKRIPAIIKDIRTNFVKNNIFSVTVLMLSCLLAYDIIINEAKQMSVNGNIKLNAANSNTGLFAQMSDDWIRNVIGRMKQQGGSLATLAQKLENNPTLITKTVTAVDKARKEFVVLRLGAY
jgi:hypothetical protein